MQEVDQRDRELLNALQGDIPVSSTPFAIVGQLIDMSEKEVLKRAEKLRRAGILRRMHLVFNTRALGYTTCLAAARVPEDRLERAASVINIHPGVYQNYQRNHEYNLWFSLSLPPDSRIGLEGTIATLAREAEFEATRIFTTLRLFTADGSVETEHAEEALTEEEIEYVRLLQVEVPLQPRPFDFIARRAGIDEEAFFEAVRRFVDRGQVVRVAATVQLRRNPFQTNAMSVWAVPADQIETFVRAATGRSSVLRCYLRPTYPDWPYNLFATVQARSIEECDAAVAELGEETGIHTWKTLYPTREYKNTRVSLFSSEIADWERSRLAAGMADEAHAAS
jgi:DNA-binding Lrp family transcriptional regulator